MDDEEVVNLRVWETISRMHPGVSLTARLLAIDIKRLDFVESIGEYLDKLTRFGWLRRDGLRYVWRGWRTDG